jgi:hypothetical protein
VAAPCYRIGNPLETPLSVQATWTFIPVVLCLPDYSSGCAAHDQQGSRVPSGAVVMGERIGAFRPAPPQVNCMRQQGGIVNAINKGAYNFG